MNNMRRILKGSPTLRLAAGGSFNVDNLSVGGLRARNEFEDDARRDVTANRDITMRSESAKYGADKQFEGQKYGADQQLAGTTLSSNNSLKGNMYGADKQFEGQKYGADSSLKGQVFTSNNALKGQMYSSDNSLAGQVYGSDQQLAGSVYGTDRQFDAGRYASDSKNNPTQFYGFNEPTTFGGVYGNAFKRPVPESGHFGTGDIDNYTTKRPYGLRDGGELQAGLGGDVPGTGRGDKIPAKYEPGEFVVSNDMLDAQPELRQHLRGLREAVLAEKGMTPEQADAKAMGGKTLRAEDGSEGIFPSLRQTYSDVGKNIAAQYDEGDVSGTLGAVVGGGLRYLKAGVDDVFINPLRKANELSRPIAGAAANFGAAALGAELSPETKAMFAPDASRVAPEVEAQRQAAAQGQAEAAPKPAAAPQPEAAPVRTLRGPDGRMYINEMVSAADHNQSNVLVKEAFNRPKKTGGEFNMDSGVKRLRDNPEAMDTANKAWAMRGSGIMASRDKNGGLVLSNSTAPEKMQYADADGKPTTRYENTQQYAQGVEMAAKVAAQADRMEAERKQAEADGYARQEREQEGNQERAEAMDRRNLAVSASSAVAGQPTQSAQVAMNSIKTLDAVGAARLAARAKATEQRVLGTQGGGSGGRPQPSGPAQGGVDVGGQMRAVLKAASDNGVDPVDAAIRMGAHVETIKAIQTYTKQQVDVANGERDDKRVGAEAFTKRITSLVGADPDGSVAGRVLEGVNATLDQHLAAARKLLAEQPGNASARAMISKIEKHGLNALGEDDIRSAVMDAKADAIAKKGAGVMPWSGEHVNTAKPVGKLTKANTTLFDQWTDGNGRVFTKSDLKNNPDMDRYLSQADREAIYGKYAQR